MIILDFKKKCTKHIQYSKHFVCLHLRQIAFKNSQTEFPSSRKSDMDWQSAVHCLSNSTNLSLAG